MLHKLFTQYIFGHQRTGNLLLAKSVEDGVLNLFYDFVQPHIIHSTNKFILQQVQFDTDQVTKFTKALLSIL